jgi:hypothetical protein
MNRLTPEVIKQLDSIYLRYGFKPKEYPGVRAYEFRNFRYYGVDLYGITENEDLVAKVHGEYARLNFATAIKSFTSIQLVDHELFKDFFQHGAIHLHLTEKYQDFIKRQKLSLPADANYEYIDSPYVYSEYDTDGIPSQEERRDSVGHSINKDIVTVLRSEKACARLILIEAAAGYGKTSTVYELIRTLQLEFKERLPFVIELSRNREARIFKHILLNEIEKQFHNSVKTDHVIHEIQQGRIPLIIDGFDELITKDISSSGSQNKEDAESIFSTILSLLNQNATIIITSRKTAIFNAEELFNWIRKSPESFQTYRFSIEKPELEKWLNRERIDLLAEHEFDIQNVANPVLLSYLRHTPYGQLRQTVESAESIIDKYFSFLYERERERQNIRFTPQQQEAILMNLAVSFATFDIKSDSKSFLRDLIKDANHELLTTYLRESPSQQVLPTIEELVDTLSNHALLDRRENGDVGFLNEFILGTLVGKSLVSGQYKDAHSTMSLDFATMVLEAFKSQKHEGQISLARAWNDYDTQYGMEFCFYSDVHLKHQLNREYSAVSVGPTFFRDIEFSPPSILTDSVVSDSTFVNCRFSFKALSGVTFLNSKFKDCQWIEVEVPDNAVKRVFFAGCTSDNDFIERLYDLPDDSSATQIDVEEEIRRLIFVFFMREGVIKPFGRISWIRRELSEFKMHDVERVLDSMSAEGWILVNGDMCFIRSSGIAHYKMHYSSPHK